MKKIAFLTFLLVSTLFVSCSEDENNTPTVDATDYFNYSANGTEIPIATWTAVRSEDSFEILGIADDGRSIDLKFNVFGDLASVSSTPASDSSDPWLNSYYEYASNYFDFSIVAIDEANKIIKVSYSGKLYEEEFDLTSPATQVEGTINVHYTVVAPQIPGIGLKADINGVAWHSVKSSTTIFGLNDMSIDFNSDDAYKIAILFPHDELVAGSYPFTPGSTTKVMISRFDVATGTYIDYNGTGTLVITEKTTVGIDEMLSGTFSFTATNPENNSQISVTNGSFKEVYHF